MFWRRTGGGNPLPPKAGMGWGGPPVPLQNIGFICFIGYVCMFFGLFVDIIGFYWFYLGFAILLAEK